MTSLCSFWTNGGQDWESEISFAFCTASFKGYNYSRTTWSGRMLSVRDLTQLKCGYWKNTNFLEGMPRATQTHVTRKECKVRRVTLLLNAPVSRYRRPLKIRDFVWEIKYWDLRTLNLIFLSMKWIKKTYLRCIPLCFSVSLLLGWRVSPKSWHGMRSGRKLVFGVRWQKLEWGIRTPLPLFQTLYQRQPG